MKASNEIFKELHHEFPEETFYFELYEEANGNPAYLDVTNRITESTFRVPLVHDIGMYYIKMLIDSQINTSFECNEFTYTSSDPQPYKEQFDAWYNKQIEGID